MMSRLLDYVTAPSNLIVILVVLGVLLLVLRRRRTAVGLLSLAAVLLLLLGFAPVGPWALGMLEDRFPPSPPPNAVAGIVLLGGSVDTHISEARSSPTFNDAGERLTTVAALAYRYPAARLIVAGGGADLTEGHPTTESEISKDILVSLGVAQSRIELEELSHNTCEDAAESKRAADPKPGETWLLVTSASHMPRAVACFRAAGFAIQPFPVDFRTRGSADNAQAAASVATGLAMADLAAHEWIGLAAYKLTGRTTDWFPAPRP